MVSSPSSKSSSSPTINANTPSSPLGAYNHDDEQEHEPPQPSFSQMIPHHPLEALQSALLTGKFSDLSIIHGTRLWNAHRVVVCSQSPMLDSRIRAVEGDKSVLTLTQYDYDSVCLMMEYFYTSNYTTVDQAPDFSLPAHVKVFCLAADFACTGLKAVAMTKYRETLQGKLRNLEVFYASVESVYATTTTEHPELRMAVVEAAIMEMRLLLADPARERFLQLTSELSDFQADIMLTLVHNPMRPVEKVVQELCEECGPRSEDDGYEVTTECKSCGAEKTLEFY
ncbi:hypothetical protein LSUB1_G001999 [Lachnellula subtilissima]|uniref:BTB domain-containing protein n=1 Tax=Lachnellula subtilissima TaxID=602034 RepID=A0A8H8UBS6_9HELO|nr:hypothetical protein LSUB1_G001999 [Lachnellula subtilissima]